MDTKLATRLEILADNTLPTVYERNRLKQLKLNYDKYETTIQKNLTQLRDGLKTLEQQLAEEEESGVTTHEDKLIQLQVKVDKLEALLGNSDDERARDILLGNRRGRSVRFNPAQEVNPSDLENGQILQLQQRLIEGE
ncbi:hypothetical protein BDC45DRAFT_328606 [Circinella umbellata]|nr:hypothetical protein BDC45DRAFT_328606 [Circinella umbellata]